MDVDVFVPGHGPVGTKDDVRDVCEILSFIEETGKKAFAAGIDDPVKLAFQTRFPEKFRGYGEQERMVLNMMALWKELNPIYQIPEFLDCICIAAEYHRIINEPELKS
jgi:cyclase